MVLDSFFNGFFGWAIEISPTFGLFVISFVVTILVTLVYKYMTDQDTLKDIKAEMKELRKEIKEAANDPERMAELNKISIEKSMQQMKQSFKPTLITMIPSLLVIYWVRDIYKDLAVNFLGITSWLWTYILMSLVISIVIRKILRVH